MDATKVKAESLLLAMQEKLEATIETTKSIREQMFSMVTSTSGYSPEEFRKLNDDLATYNHTQLVYHAAVETLSLLLHGESKFFIIKEKSE